MLTFHAFVQHRFQGKQVVLPKKAMLRNLECAMVTANKGSGDITPDKEPELLKAERGRSL